MVDVINACDIYDDVLERIDGYESYVGFENNSKIYSVGVLENILFDGEDDTNETTKHRINELFNLMDGAHILFILEYANPVSGEYIKSG